MIIVFKIKILFLGEKGGVFHIVFLKGDECMSVTCKCNRKVYMCDLHMCDLYMCIVHPELKL